MAKGLARSYALPISWKTLVRLDAADTMRSAATATTGSYRNAARPTPSERFATAATLPAAASEVDLAAHRYDICAPPRIAIGSPLACFSGRCRLLCVSPSTGPQGVARFWLYRLGYNRVVHWKIYRAGCQVGALGVQDQQSRGCCRTQAKKSSVRLATLLESSKAGDGVADTRAFRTRRSARYAPSAIAQKSSDQAWASEYAGQAFRRGPGEQRTRPFRGLRSPGPFFPWLGSGAPRLFPAR